MRRGDQCSESTISDDTVQSSNSRTAKIDLCRPDGVSETLSININANRLRTGTRMCSAAVNNVVRVLNEMEPSQQLAGNPHPVSTVESTANKLVNPQTVNQGAGTVSCITPLPLSTTIHALQPMVLVAHPSLIGTIPMFALIPVDPSRISMQQ